MKPLLFSIATLIATLSVNAQGSGGAFDFSANAANSNHIDLGNLPL